MSLPDFRELNTGDIRDDDPQVIDDLVQPAANPAKPLPDEMTVAVEKRPDRLTRLITGRIDVLTAWEAVKLLNPDAERKSVTVQMLSAADTDTLYVGDDIATARNGGAINEANGITLNNYTGAVWVYNPTGNTITVNYWSVTC